MLSHAFIYSFAVHPNTDLPCCCPCDNLSATGSYCNIQYGERCAPCTVDWMLEFMSVVVVQYNVYVTAACVHTWCSVCVCLWSVSLSAWYIFPSFHQTYVHLSILVSFLLHIRTLIWKLSITAQFFFLYFVVAATIQLVFNTKVYLKFGCLLHSCVVFV